MNLSACKKLFTLYLSDLETSKVFNLDRLATGDSLVDKRLRFNAGLLIDSFFPFVHSSQ